MIDLDSKTIAAALALVVSTPVQADLLELPPNTNLSACTCTFTEMPEPRMPTFNAFSCCVEPINQYEREHHKYFSVVMPDIDFRKNLLKERIPND